MVIYLLIHRLFKFPAVLVFVLAFSSSHGVLEEGDDCLVALVVFLSPPVGSLFLVHRRQGVGTEVDWGRSCHFRA